MTSFSFLRKDKNHKCFLQVTIVPDSAKNECVGIYGIPERLKIKIKAVPEDGKANEMLIYFLAEFFKIKKANIEIFRGHTSKKKDLFVDESYEKLHQIITECLKSIQSK